MCINIRLVANEQHKWLNHSCPSDTMSGISSGYMQWTQQMLNGVLLVKS